MGHEMCDEKLETVSNVTGTKQKINKCKINESCFMHHKRKGLYPH